MLVRRVGMLARRPLRGSLGMLHLTSLTHKKVAALDADARAQQLPQLTAAGWTTVSGRDAVNKKFNFSNFNEAWSWMSSVALAAEKLDHHPEWFNVYNKVDVTWSTHDCGGLSMKDVKMAKFCDDAAARYQK